MNVAQLLHNNIEEKQTEDKFVFSQKRRMAEEGDIMEIDNCMGLDGNAPKRRRREQVPCQQKTYLETVFKTIQYPDAHLRSQLASRFGTSPRKIQIWFQNRRTKAKVDGQKSTKTEDPATTPAAEKDLTPLLTSIKNGNLRLIKQLLEQNEPANYLNVCDPARGYSPLHMAAFYGFDDIVQYLLSFEQTHINIRDNDNYTPLHLCCLYRRTTIASMLLKAGAIPNAVSTEGYTPLHASALIGDLATLRLLLASSANVDAVDSQGFSALAFAVREGHEDLFEELLKSKASTTLRTDSGATLLHLACHSNIRIDVIQKLLELGLRLDTENKAGVTPEALLIKAGRQDVISMADSEDMSALSLIQRRMNTQWK